MELELPHSQVRDGLVHPMQAALSAAPSRAEAEELHRLATTRSAGFALHTTLERKHLSTIGRPLMQSILPSSGVLLEQFNNTQSTMGFEDWLPTEKPSVVRPRRDVETQYYGEELGAKRM